MTESSSSTDQPVVEEVELTEFLEWVNQESTLEIGREVEVAYTESSVGSISGSKRKHGSVNWSQGNHRQTDYSARNQYKVQRCKGIPNPPATPALATSAASAAVGSQIVIENENDEYVVAYIKDEDEADSVMVTIHTCPLCNKGYILDDCLVRHITAEHPEAQLATIEEDKPAVDGVICPHCHIEYASERSLKRHITSYHTAAEIERESKTCPECRGSFTSVGTLHRHLTTWHNQIKQFVCRHCEASFGEELYLRRHLSERHTGGNPLACAPCGLRFRSKSDTLDHLRSAVHVRPPFKCDQCGKIAPSRTALLKPCGAHTAPLARASGNPEETLKQLRNTDGPSLDSLAKKLGISPGTTEQGSLSPSTGEDGSSLRCSNEEDDSDGALVVEPESEVAEEAIVVEPEFEEQFQLEETQPEDEDEDDIIFLN